MRKQIFGVLFTLIFIGFSIWGSIFNVEQEKSDKNKNDAKGVISQCEINCTNLPIMLVQTNGAKINKESKVSVEISVIDQTNGNSITLNPNMKTDATIKYRGNSSYTTFDKKQYSIEFFKSIKTDRERNYPLFGMNTNSDWVLNGPFLDRTLIRNHLMYGLSRDLMKWAPDSRFFELYIDDEYRGVYLAVEPISMNENRIELNKFGLLSGETPYIVNRDRVETNDNIIHTYGELKGFTLNELSIHYPGKKSLTSKQYAWIEQDISRFEEALYSDYFDNPEIGYAKYIDVPSFVDYFILNELAMITDSSQLSTYAYKDLGGKLTFTVWDFNNGFNNYQWNSKSIEKLYNLDSSWYNRLLQDRKFIDAIIERYTKIRQNELSNQTIMQRIDDDIKYLGLAVDRNFEVWGYTFNQNLLSKDELGETRDPSSYEEAILMLKNTIEKRLAYLDENMRKLYDYSIN